MRFRTVSYTERCVCVSVCEGVGSRTRCGVRVWDEVLYCELYRKVWVCVSVCEGGGVGRGVGCVCGMGSCAVSYIERCGCV